jgi:hypothetical protein
MITSHGQVVIPEAVTIAADSIKLLNYRTSSPARFQKRTLTDAIASQLMKDISELIGIESTRLDYVYFSVCRGAEPHVDLLDPLVFETTTYIVPVILPPGLNIITCESSPGRIDHQVVEVGAVYSFEHTSTHGMTVSDQESGCVVIMIAIKR